MKEGRSIVKVFLKLASCAALAFVGFNLTSSAHAESILADPSSGILVSGAQPVCDQAVMVCGRQLSPLAAELGGSFTVKINGHFRSTYECTMNKGAPQWTSVFSDGTCDEVPIITLPSKYEDQAESVG